MVDPPRGPGLREISPVPRFKEPAKRQDPETPPSGWEGCRFGRAPRLVLGHGARKDQGVCVFGDSGPSSVA